MTETIKFLAELMNKLHDFILLKLQIKGITFTDKQLHFIILGVIGMIIFLATHIVFKRLAKYTITAISFIYTITVLSVIIFAIEIEQKLTKRGRMEFADIEAGFYGFLFLFSIYLMIKLIIYCIKRLILKNNDKPNYKQ